jgi:lysophospholipase L1-like esterase
MVGGELTGDPRIVEGYARVVDQLRKNGARVVLIGPPLPSGRRAQECTGEFNMVRAAIANRVNAPLIDFTCAAVDDRWFVDYQHLSSPGRARFTRALSEAF